MTDLITDTVAVGEEAGQVKLIFPKPIQWAVFDPQTAKEIGMAMAKTSYEIISGQKQEISGAKVLTAEIEAKLINRLTHVIRSLSEKGKPTGFIAQECLTVVLREVY